MDIYEEEKKYLKYVLKCIEDELILSKDKVEELREEGISLSYEDTKRGEHLNISSMINLYSDRIRLLNASALSPYFGRFDFRERGSNSTAKIYVGKNDVSLNGKQIVTDWRSPICSLYYDSELGKVSYKAPAGEIEGLLELKRQIEIKNSQLINVFDTNLVSNDELLKPYLNINADNKMKTIVASIQKEQNQIIRKSILDNIIVQGVAGSGKTSVALHRVAYLLYNLGARINSDQFLILGPNDYFLNYISSILPELETNPVEQMTLISLANKYLNDNLSLEENKKNIKKESDKRIVEKIENYKCSLEYKNNLDLFINYYLSNMVVNNDFEIAGNIIYTKENIKSILLSESNKHPKYNFAYKHFSEKYKNEFGEIYDKLNEKYKAIYTTLPKDDPKRIEAVEKSTELYYLLKEKGPKLLKSYFNKLELKTTDLYMLFIANIDKFNQELTKKEVLMLQKISLPNLKKKKVFFEDIPALMYINYVLSENKLDYKHVIIDEAQDYGLFHYYVIKEIINKCTFSIYGDLAQEIYPHKGVESWEVLNSKVFDDKCQLLHLNKSYRTTIEITNNANNILEFMGLNSAEPVIRHGIDVQFFDEIVDNDYKYEKIKEWIDKGYKSIAVICKTEDEAQIVNEELLKNNFNSKYISAKDSKYDGELFTLSSASSKGLEFDAVIINDASSNVYNEDSNVDMHLLYVASTRALHELLVVYNNQLTKAFGCKIDNSIDKAKAKVLKK